MGAGITTRRALIAALPVAAGAAAGLWLLRGPSAPALTPDEALRRSEAGALLIVDIRRPDEWRQTGVAIGAATIDMRREDFSEALAEARRLSGGLPAAIICARGVRSARVARRLAAAGLTDVYDIPEGMEGWLRRGLPVRMMDETG